MQQMRSKPSFSLSTHAISDLLETANKYRRLAAILPSDDPSRASLVATAGLLEATAPSPSHDAAEGG